jgi:hypothetical protein
MAFGLAISADFAFPGLPPALATDDLPSVDVRLARDRDIADAWPARGTRRLSEDRFGEDRPVRTLDGHPALGYRIYADSFGVGVLESDGSLLRYAPAPVPPWSWQRFLVGRCLPIAALLRGYEVLHAAAVASDGGVLAIAGPTASGKTSIAVRLMLGGARFFTDDVLALESAGDGLRSWPGFGVLNVRAPEHALLSDAERDRLGERLGQTAGGKVHYATEVTDDSLPLRALYFIVPSRAKRTAISAMHAPDPLKLLASTLLHQVRRPEHLARLLDICSRLGAGVPLFEVASSPSEDAATIAARLAEHDASRVAL